MMMRFRLSAGALALMFACTSPAQGAEPDDAAKPGTLSLSAVAPDGNDREAATARLDTYLGATASLRARFRSTLLNERGLPLAESSGVVLVKRPNRFRWEYLEPAPSLILADGEKLWSYDADLEQAVVRKLADLKGANPTNLLGGNADVSEDFDVLGSYVAGDITWIDLVPRGGTSDFTRVRVGFAGDRIELMEMHDQLGQITRIQLTELELNPELDDALFVFEPPPGVDVVGAN